MKPKLSIILPGLVLAGLAVALAVVLVKNKSTPEPEFLSPTNRDSQPSVAQKEQPPQLPASGEQKPVPLILTNLAGEKLELSGSTFTNGSGREIRLQSIVSRGSNQPLTNATSSPAPAKND